MARVKNIFDDQQYFLLKDKRIKLKNVRTYLLLNQTFLLSLAFCSLLFIGCSNSSKKNGTTAIFDSKAEAEQAAKNFNCKGAHKMGTKWMPCEKHGSYTNHNH